MLDRLKRNLLRQQPRGQRAAAAAAAAADDLRSGSSAGYTSHGGGGAPHAHDAQALGTFEVGERVGVDGRYHLSKLVGRGHFAAVWAARDRKRDGAEVALKVLEGPLSEDGKVEHGILQRLVDADPNQTQRVMRLFSAFFCPGRYVLVLPLLGPPLSSRRFGVREGFVTRQELQVLAKQLSDTLAFVHGTALIHTDLKPDNILLQHALPPDARTIGSSFIITDFGNAFYHMFGHDGQSLITTRPYRSPEAVTHQGWRHATDMWSVGCILYEVWAGKLLFNVANDDDGYHVDLIAQRIGGIPWLRQHANVPPSKFLHERVEGDPELKDLLLRLLTCDQDRRLRAKEMCHHPFVAGGGPVGAQQQSPPHPHTTRRAPHAAHEICCSPDGSSNALPTYHAGGGGAASIHHQPHAPQHRPPHHPPQYNAPQQQQQASANASFTRLPPRPVPVTMTRRPFGAPAETLTM